MDYYFLGPENGLNWLKKMYGLSYIQKNRQISKHIETAAIVVCMVFPPVLSKIKRTQVVFFQQSIEIRTVFTGYFSCLAYIAPADLH